MFRPDYTNERPTEKQKEFICQMCETLNIDAINFKDKCKARTWISEHMHEFQEVQNSDPCYDVFDYPDYTSYTGRDF